MRWKKWLRNSLLVVAVLAIGIYLARDVIFFTFLYRGTRADWELSQIRRQYDNTQDEFADLVRENEDPGTAAVQEARKQRDERNAEFRRKCLELAAANPGTKAELTAHFFIAGTWPDTDDGQRSLAMLCEKVATADLDQLGKMLQSTPVRSLDRLHDLAAALAERARADASDPNAAILLTTASSIYSPEPSAPEATPEFTRIADLIVEQHATSPHISNFCVQFGNGNSSSAWGQPFEPHLRKILAVNRDRFVRSSAKIALACLVQDSGFDRQEEAQKLFEEFLVEFDGQTKHRADGIEEMYRHSAQRQLEILKSHGRGMPAPAITGIDLDGRPMTLEEFRGKVVLVSFWASWCGPCLAMMPHEKEMLKKFPADRFAIVGVNSDVKLDRAHKVVAQKEIPWRNFRNETEGQPEIADRWHISGYPTFYLLDPQGIVRRRWIGDQPPEEMEKAIELLLADRLPQKQESTAPEVSERKYAPISVRNDEPGARGFVGKVHRSAGQEFRYVVFVPAHETQARARVDAPGYNAGEPLPVILFLHGSGYSGDDGRRQLTGALAAAVQDRQERFPFLVVFPQSHGEDWQAKSADGKRALAILDEVLDAYPTDRSRVILTGLSMGGEGTWSLAAAYPERWAAIVPLCGGGDPATATRIAHIPCWCFHGEADRMIPAILSQKMVEAIRKAGGEPLYQLYPGVDHNCWDQTYGREDLYEWMLRQKKG